VWQFGEKYRPSFSYVWSRFMTEGVMGCHLKLVGSRGLYKDGPCVYLANHRAWSDFFIDMYLTEGRAFILSRYLVVYVFPLFAAPAMFIGAVFAFKRNKPGQHEALNANLDAHLAAYPDFKGMVVYPEGTRNVRPDALPLRRGLIKYAWSRGLDVQVIIASDKEHVLSSHLYSASWGVEILCGYGAVVGRRVGPRVRRETREGDLASARAQTARAEGAARGVHRGRDGAPDRVHPRVRPRRDTRRRRRREASARVTTHARLFGSLSSGASKSHRALRARGALDPTRANVTILVVALTKKIHTFRYA
jgi:1-acyl-sn-glycerol-3-phosphate acyltransferase